MMRNDGRVQCCGTDVRPRRTQFQRRAGRLPGPVRARRSVLVPLARCPLPKQGGVGLLKGGITAVCADGNSFRGIWGVLDGRRSRNKLRRNQRRVRSFTTRLRYFRTARVGGEAHRKHEKHRGPQSI